MVVVTSKPLRENPAGNWRLITGDPLSPGCSQPESEVPLGPFRYQGKLSALFSLSQLEVLTADGVLTSAPVHLDKCGH